MALAGGTLPETVCSHLGGAGGGAWQILQYLDRWDAAALRLTCQELRDMTGAYSAWRRLKGFSWDWPLGRLLGRVSTLAGSAESGCADGVGAAARFSYPWGLAVRPDGSVLVADSCNHTIRCISAAGLVSTLAGAAGQVGSTDGQGAAARFSSPNGIALGPDGRLYVADTDNHTIRCISAAGVVSTLAGAAGQEGSADGLGAAARFSRPFDIALGPDGSLFVADMGNDTIRCISAEGAVSTLAGAAGQLGIVDGRGPAARFAEPMGLAVGPDGSLFVTDSHAVRRIT